MPSVTNTPPAGRQRRRNCGPRARRKKERNSDHCSAAADFACGGSFRINKEHEYEESGDAAEASLRRRTDGILKAWTWFIVDAVEKK